MFKFLNFYEGAMENTHACSTIIDDSDLEDEGNVIDIIDMVYSYLQFIFCLLKIYCLLIMEIKFFFLFVGS